MPDREGELKKICKKWLFKALDMGLREDSMSTQVSEFCHPMIDLSWTPEMVKEIEAELKKEVEGLQKRLDYLLQDCDESQFEEEFEQWEKEQGK